MATTTRRGFGYLRRLPSKRWQASYRGPDQVRHHATITFERKADAESWLSDERRRIESGDWTSPAARAAAAAAAEAAAEPDDAPLTIADFVASWLPDTELRSSTRRDYTSLLKNHILPTLGDVPLEDLTRARVRLWWGHLDPNTPRARLKAYQLLHNVMNAAVDAELIATNPVALPRRSRARASRRRIDPLTLSQLRTLADNMPPRLRMAVILGFSCALRYGELAELRRSDVDVDSGTLTVSRGVVKVKGGYEVGPPKTAAGVRVVHIPPVILPELRAHIREHAGWGRDGLLFPASNGGHLHSTTFARAFAVAAEAAGRPDVTPHTLRHTGATLNTEAGASIPDNMGRLGHTSAAAAMIYQHSLDGADERIAKRLSDLIAEGWA